MRLPVCNVGTAENLFNHIDSALEKYGIPWSNVVGFESDTTNVVVGINTIQFFLV